jgi:hypothetical protein
MDTLDSMPEYDWDEIIRIFKEPAKLLEFYTIDFSPSTSDDFTQLDMPKKINGDLLYTAGFFCRKGTNWFIYRVMYSVPKLVMPEDKPGIFKKLEINARTTMDTHKRAKNPLKYLKDITL